MDRRLFEILFGIITVVLFVMWCMWDKKVNEKIKKYVKNCICDVSKKFPAIIWLSKHIVLVNSDKCLAELNVLKKVGRKEKII